jgi:cytoskeleton protein RodZ
MAEQDDVIDFPRDAASSSVGTQLRQAREARGMSIDSVGRAIKLAPRQVEAIEADDFGSLMSPTYVRGFIRNYAALLGLDVQVLLGRLDQQHVRATPQLLEQADVGVAMPMQSAQRKWLLPLLALSVPALVGLALYLWFEFWPAEAPVMDQAPVAGQVEPVPDDVSTPYAMAPFDLAPAEEGGTLPPLSDLGQPDSAAPTGEASADTAAAEPLPGQRQLAFTFSVDSWVEVRDSNDAIIVSDLNRGGSVRTVNVTFPVSLVIGNARAVTLKVDGQAYDLAPATKVDVARLRLE